MKDNKNSILLKIAFVAGIAAIVLIFLSGGEENSQPANITEQRIAQLVTSMEGVGKDTEVNVMIRLADDNYTVKGVTIVCKCPVTNGLREKITAAISIALDVPYSKICITT